MKVGAMLLAVLLSTFGVALWSELGRALGASIVGRAGSQTAAPQLQLGSAASAGSISIAARAAKQAADVLEDLQRGVRSFQLGEVHASSLEKIVATVDVEEPVSFSFRVKHRGESLLSVEDDLRNAGLELPHLRESGTRELFAHGQVGTIAEPFVGERLSDVRNLERTELESFALTNVYRKLFKRAREAGLSKPSAHDEAFYGARRHLELRGGDPLPEWAGPRPHALHPRSPRPAEVRLELQRYPEAFPMARKYWDDDLRTGVDYLPERYQLFHRIKVREGRLVDAWGRPLTTTPKREHIFAITLEGKLLEGVGERDRFHHSSLTSGRSGPAFGRLEVQDGLLTRLSPNSGHFEPVPASMDTAVEVLRAQGADMSRATVSYSFDE